MELLCLGMLRCWVIAQRTCTWWTRRVKHALSSCVLRRTSARGEDRSNSASLKRSIILTKWFGLAKFIWDALLEHMSFKKAKLGRKGGKTPNDTCSGISSKFVTPWCIVPRGTALLMIHQEQGVDPSVDPNNSPFGSWSNASGAVSKHVRLSQEHDEHIVLVPALEWLQIRWPIKQQTRRPSFAISSGTNVVREKWPQICPPPLENSGTARSATFFHSRTRVHGALAAPSILHSWI